MEEPARETRLALQQMFRRGTRPRTRSYRARTSHVALFEDVLNAAGAADGGNPTNEFATERDKVEGDIDRLSLGCRTEYAACCVELSLIHHDVLPYPALATSSRSFRAGLAGTTSQIHVFDVCHTSPICMNRIIGLYAILP